MTLHIPFPTKKKREIPDAGLYGAVCVDAINLSIQPSYNGKKKQKCRLVFELDATDSQDRRFILCRTYTASLHERSSLRQDLESWRDKSFSQEELSEGFDLQKVVRQSCEIKITHKKAGENTYAQIDAINPPKGHLKPSGEYTRVKDR